MYESNKFCKKMAKLENIGKVFARKIFTLGDLPIQFIENSLYPADIFFSD